MDGKETVPLSDHSAVGATGKVEEPVHGKFKKLLQLYHQDVLSKFKGF